MINGHLTNEFSIILNLNKEWTDKVNEAREQLPASSVRTDRPHMTLIRAISSAKHKSDEELVETIKPHLLRLLDKKMTATVSAIKNHPDTKLFGLTGVIMVKVSQLVLDVRQSLIQYLENNGYTVASDVKESYLPHVTFQLGVALSDELRTKMEKIIPIGSTLRFDSWSLLREILKDGKRLAREVPGSD